MTPMNTPLKNFLMALSRDRSLVARFNRSDADARAVMAEAGLSDAHQSLLLSHDARAIAKEIAREGFKGRYFAIPSGPPTMDPPDFEMLRVEPDGVMMFDEAEPLSARAVRKAPARKLAKKAAKKAAKKSKVAKKTAKKAAKKAKGTRRGAKRGR